jgi:hypothetical protein
MRAYANNVILDVKHVCVKLFGVDEGILSNVLMRMQMLNPAAEYAILCNMHCKALQNSHRRKNGCQKWGRISGFSETNELTG